MDEGCVMCGVGRCPPDCMYKEVLPGGPSVVDESKKKSRKIWFTCNRQYFKKCYADVYSKKGVDAAKALVHSWEMEYDARGKNPTLGLVALIEKNETKIKSLKKLLKMYEDVYGPLKEEEDVAP